MPKLEILKTKPVAENELSVMKEIATREMLGVEVERIDMCGLICNVLRPSYGRNCIFKLSSDEGIITERYLLSSVNQYRNHRCPFISEEVVKHLCHLRVPKRTRW